MSAAEHAPAVFFADFHPISASRSAAVSATFAGQSPPVPPLDEVDVPPEDEPPLDDPPDDEVLPPEDDVLPPLEEVLPPLDEELFPPDDDPPEELPPEDDDFPPDDEEEVLPEDDPPLDDDAVGSVPFGSSVHGVGVVEAVQARAKAAADAATRAA